MEKGLKFKVGTNVLIRDNNSSSLNWRMGRVKSVNSGCDRLIRPVLVQTMMGEYIRVVRNLRPLPFNENGV